MSLLLRMVAASLATGLSSALVLTVVLSASLGFDLTLFVFTWFVGSLVSVATALILGIMIEMPKSYWLSRRDAGGKLLHVLLSITGAQAVCFAWILFDSQQLRTFTPRTADYSLLWIAFTVGGLCSALFWWVLVVKPWRMERTTNPDSDPTDVS